MKKASTKIRKIRHKPLKVVYNSNKEYDEFLRSNSETSVHQRWLGALTLSWRKSLSYRNQSTDFLWKSINWFLYDRDLRHKIVNMWIFKSLNNVNPEFVWSYFIFKNTTYNIRNGTLLRLLTAKSTQYGTNLVIFRASLL